MKGLGSMNSNRSRRKKFLDSVRTFNKYFFNRITLLFAQRGIGPFSIVTHIGRRSKRVYKTPVLATYTSKMIIIPLSYGEGVDWLRNVLVKNGCSIRYKGEEITAEEPLVLDAADALTLLPDNRRTLFERFKLEKFLRLSRKEKKHKMMSIGGN